MIRALSNPTLTILALAIGAWVIVTVAYLMGFAVLASMAGAL